MIFNLINKKLNHYKIRIEAFFIFVLAFLISFLIIKVGRLITPDSIVYLSVAENLANKGSFTAYNGTPLTTWMPATSLLLSIGYFLNINQEIWTRLIYALVMSGLSLVSFLIFYRLTGHRLFAMTFALLITLWTPILRVFHVWSEPFFLLFLSLVIFFYIKYLEEFKKNKLLFLGFFIMIITMVRHAGLFVFLGVLVATLLGRSNSFISRFKRILVLASISLLPYMLWLVRTYYFTGGATGRPFILEGINKEVLLFCVRDLFSGGFLFGEFFGYQEYIIFFLTVITLLFIIYYIKNRELIPSKIRNIFYHLMIVVFTYIFFIWFTVQFIDRGLYDEFSRLFVPVFFMLYIIFFSALYYFYKKKTLVKFFLVIIIIVIYIGELSVFVNIFEDQISYKERAKLNLSEASIEKIETKIYTNIPEYIYWASKRSHAVYELPRKTFRYNNNLNNNYEKETESLIEELKNKQATIVIYDSNFTEYRTYYVSYQEIISKIDLSPIYDKEGLSIFIKKSSESVP